MENITKMKNLSIKKGVANTDLKIKSQYILKTSSYPIQGKIDKIKNYNVPIHIGSKTQSGNILVGIFSFTDESVSNRTCQVTIAWGDGTESEGIVKTDMNLYRVFGRHEYLFAGLYKITIKVQSGKTTLGSITNNVTVGNIKERFLSHAIINLTGGKPDNSTLKYWNSLLDKGISNAHVLGEMMSLESHKRIITENWYKILLNRHPKADDFKKSIALLNEDDGINKLKLSLLNSTEYYKAKGRGTNSGFVRALLEDLLPGIPEPNHSKDWIKSLNEGTATSEITTAIIKSAPAQLSSILKLHEWFLGQTLSTNDLIRIVDELNKGKSESEIIINSICNPAYLFPEYNSLISTTTPDFLFQLAVYLNFFGPNTRQDLINSVNNYITNNIPDDYLYLFPNPYFNTVAWGDQEHGGFWRNAPDIQYEEQILTNTPDIRNNDLYVFEFIADALRDIICDIWNKGDKRVDDSGNPDKNGKVELKNNSFEIRPDKQLILKIYGTYHDKIDVDFTATITFIFWLENGVVQYRIVNSLDKDDWGIKLLEAIIGIFIPFPPEGLLFGWIEGKLDKGNVPNYNSLGLLIKMFFPDKILLPNSNKKFVFYYDNLTFDSSVGIRVSGTQYPFQDRERSADIVVPIKIYHNDTRHFIKWVKASSPILRAAKVVCYVTTIDMRGKLTVIWAVNGVSLKSTDPFVEILLEFDPDKQSYYLISAQIKDEDGFEITTSKYVHYMGEEDEPYVPLPHQHTGLPKRIEEEY